MQKFVAAGLTCFVSTSFSKSFSLYGERVGALSVLCDSKEEADRVLSQLKIVIRTNYSNPPTHGGAVVATVLNNPELRALWEKELGEMRVRIKAMRQKLVDGLKAAGIKQDMSFITQQIGMFSYSGLSKDQMVRLRTEFGVYGTDTGRMCVAASQSRTIRPVCSHRPSVSFCASTVPARRAYRAWWSIYRRLQTSRRVSVLPPNRRSPW